MEQSMKQSIAGTGGSATGGCRIPSQDEVEVIGILLNLPKIISVSELLSQYSFTWARKKKRSVLVSKQDLSLSLFNQQPVNEVIQFLPEKVTAAEADKSPSTPLCFLPSVGKNLKKKEIADLLERYNIMQQEREILLKKIKAMKTHHQELTAQNLELKAKRDEIIYSRTKEDFQLWNNDPVQHVYQQNKMTMFAPPQQQQQCQQFMLDPNHGKLACSSNNNNGTRFGMLNHIDPRVHNIHGEAYDFMSLFQPLDQSKCIISDNELKARNAAAARKRRILRMKHIKNKNSSLLSMKMSRGGCR
uniref:uncharacterized protein LOC122585377 n=1 Tax=Erigeron canadensis TaxID=72917 RepID=UPI001CB8ACDB|nr:uncharacterized protein LOC122585377 [Erigeron canadensis]